MGASAPVGPSFGIPLFGRRLPAVESGKAWGVDDTNAARLGIQVFKLRRDSANTV